MRLPAAAAALFGAFDLGVGGLGRPLPPSLFGSWPLAVHVGPAAGRYVVAAR